MRSIFKKSLILSAVILPALALAQPAPPSPITNINQIVNLFNSILFWVSSIFWICAGICTLYAGFLYMTASGDSEKTGKAKKQLLYAIIAIAIGLMGPGLSVLVNAFLSGM